MTKIFKGRQQRTLGRNSLWLIALSLLALLPLAGSIHSLVGFTEIDVGLRSHHLTQASDERSNHQSISAMTVSLESAGLRSSATEEASIDHVFPECEDGMSELCAAALRAWPNGRQSLRLELYLRGKCDSRIIDSGAFCRLLGEHLALSLHEKINILPDESAERLVLLDEARRANLAGCEDGSLYNCRILINGVIGDDQDFHTQQAKFALERACARETATAQSANAESSCAFLASSLLDRGLIDDAVALSEQACRSGFAVGCLERASIASAVDEDWLSTMMFVKQFCELSGRQDLGCQQLRETGDLDPELIDTFYATRVSDGKGHEKTIAEILGDR